MKRKAALLFSTLAMATALTGCKGFEKEEPKLMSLEIFCNKTVFYAPALFLANSNTYVKGYYSNGEEKVLPYEDVELIYVDTKTNMGYDISYPLFPGDYYLRARVDLLSSNYYYFTVYMKS